MSFEWPVRVYYEDTDAGGVVYHTSYIRFLERARTEWLRSIGYSQARLANDMGLVFTVVSLDIKYLLPARLDDMLLIRSDIEAGGGASMNFDQAIHRGEQQLVRGKVIVACLDATTFKPRRLPAAMREDFN
ncbi:MAG: tol-pal system-associated acyl-CoA thioesterase [Pseudomonadota bacterium]